MKIVNLRKARKVVFGILDLTTKNINYNIDITIKTQSTNNHNFILKRKK